MFEVIGFRVWCVGVVRRVLSAVLAVLVVSALLVGVGGAVGRVSGLCGVDGAAGRLTGVSSGGSTVQTRTYQPEGRLRSVVAGTATSLLDWDPAGGDVAELVGVQTGANAVGLFGAPTGLGGVKSGVAVSGLGQDWFGSVKSGVLAASTTGYDAWGKPNTAYSSWVPKLGYRGEVTTGPLTHLRARDYQASTAVFTTVDPLEQLPGSTVTANRYGYVLNQPTMLVDPSGKTAEDDCSRHPDTWQQDAANGFGGFLEGMTFGHADDLLGLIGAEDKWCGRTDTARAWGVGGKVFGAVVVAAVAAPVAGAVVAAFPVAGPLVLGAGAVVGGLTVGRSVGDCVEGVVDDKTDQAWEACGDFAAAVAGTAVGAWATRGTIKPGPTPNTTAATDAGSGAESAVMGRNLGRQLASEQQVGEAGTALAGAGTSTELRAASRLADQYGGSASDWAKMGGSSYRGADGLQFETHWYENIPTGQRVEFKTKITGGAP